MSTNQLAIWAVIGLLMMLYGAANLWSIALAVFIVGCTVIGLVVIILIPGERP